MPPKKKSNRRGNLDLDRFTNDSVSQSTSTLSGNYLLSAESIQQTVELLHACPSQYITLEDVDNEKSGHMPAVKFSCSKCEL